jgi:hypothetical protein
LKYFLLQYIFYSVDEYMSHWIFVYHLLFTMHVCCLEALSGRILIFEIMKVYCNVGCTFSVMYNLLIDVWWIVCCV